ncbi:aspartate aminotransferase family protein [Natronincola ferrireducens]|uniref:Acetylornithine aminotransferase n=1 Tax=Natronincola ferrireducens TaxID=393762 RepID=A0A1G8YVG5_9FIRM|nr:aspartate aminotransferase family protein [Natronincola ferrireducens]SDK06852.1 acetylornithine aminotransferase [Natronincola ferrireducens]
MLDSIIQQGQKYTMNTYNRLPVAFTKGEGCYLTDTEEKEYLDMIGGLGACGLGHNHPIVTKAIQQQAEKYIHVSNIYWIKEQVELAKLLVENSFGDKAFFCNSGAEANEAAIKLARKYAYKKYGSQKNEIIAMTQSFHGRTLGTLAVTHNKKYQEGYGPIPEGFGFTKFNDIAGLKAAITENTCGIILEPIQGEGGVTPIDGGFLKEIKSLCQEKDILLIFDEVQCGIGRSGKLFAYESYGIEPDIMTLAKALGSGIPIGAVVAKGKVAEALQPGDHGTTFGGNPLSTSVALATMKFMVEEKLWEKAEEMGLYLHEKLQQFTKKYTWIKTVKGKGLMVGLELEIEGGSIVEKALKEGLLINCTAGKILRFLPPLIVEKQEIDKMVEILERIFSKL